MAKTFTLQDVTQAQVDAADARIVSMLAGAIPELDVRRGTALRELLVRPQATIDAFETARYDYLGIIQSLAKMQANPGTYEDADVQALLNNFGMTMHPATYAYGLIRVMVGQNRTYVVASNFRFVGGGKTFIVPGTYTVRSTPGAAELALVAMPDGSGYYFLLPVTAAEAGPDSRLKAGTTLVPQGSIDTFVMADVYSDLNGGVSAESLDAAIARIPYAIANRSLDSATSIGAMLTSPDAGDFSSIRALSVAGAGSPVQLRDKHNAEGVGMGGKVDVYVRTFELPDIVVLQKKATRIDANTYSFDITRAEAGAFYCVRGVFDLTASSAGTIDPASLRIIGSYPFSVVRREAGSAGSGHDVQGAIEAALTIYQAATCVVTDVPSTANELDFKVELVSSQEMQLIQEYMDSTSVRNVKADHLARSPMLVYVSLRCTLVVASGVTLDIDAIKTNLAQYINALGFGSRLSSSEIMSRLHQFPIRYVDISAVPNVGFSMTGSVMDAAGVVHRLPGPDLDVADIADAQVLLHPTTCVFVADPLNMYISTRVG